MLKMFPKLGYMSTPNRGKTRLSIPGIVPEMGNNLKILRERRGWTHDVAASKLGLSRSGYIKLERGERKLSDRFIRKAAAAYSVSEQEIFSAPRMAPVVGYAGAGGSVIYDTAADGEDSIDCPPDAPPDTVAVQIRGDSLGAGFDRWFALYARRYDPITEDLVGRLCVVGTDDGRTLIKWVRHGASGFTLLSGTGVVEENAAIIWAAAVIDLRPR